MDCIIMRRYSWRISFTMLELCHCLGDEAVPGFLLHVGAAVMCMHGGQAQPTMPNPRVMVGGQPIVTQPTPYAIVGCPFVPPAGNGPCVTAQWVVGAMRVFAGGAPVLLQTTQAICAPTGTPLKVIATQMRVMGT